MIHHLRCFVNLAFADGEDACHSRHIDLLSRRSRRDDPRCRVSEDVAGVLDDAPDLAAPKACALETILAMISIMHRESL
jgi:hypothetical protein